MIEYFISYYGCESKIKNGTRRTCSKCLKNCEQRELLYRCWVGDLTGNESAQFKQDAAESGWLEQIIGECVIHSAQDIPVGTVNEKKEHVVARTKFECLPVSQTRAIRQIMHIAYEIREFRCVNINAPCLIETAAVFYELEEKVLSKKIHHHLEKHNKTIAKCNEQIKTHQMKIRELDAQKRKLTKQIESIEAQKTLTENRFLAWKQKQQEKIANKLEAIQSGNFIEGASDCTPASTDIDIADLIDDTKGRFVEYSEFLNENINAQSLKFTSKKLQHAKTNGNVVWSTKNPAIGQGKIGKSGISIIFERTKFGDNKNNYRYRYFLFREYDKTIVTG